MTLSSNLKVLRERKGLTQKELSEQVGTTQSNIASFELGIKIPSLNITVLLSNILGCTLDELVRGEK